MTESAPTTLPGLRPDELAGLSADPDAGCGALRTSAGNLPLVALDVAATLTGLSSRTVLTQTFVNPHREPLEASYVFPLPDRGAVTGLRLTAQGRTVVARLRERGQARTEYDAAVRGGQRAAIAEEERPDVFTLRVGNILPGEQVVVELTVVGTLPVADGEATFRFPLVVAPRYVPGSPLPGDAVGEGWQPDTDAVPDASRISPPVLLPGFPHRVRLSVTVRLDPAGLPMGTPRSSLHAVRIDGDLIRFSPGERADRDVILRIPLGSAGTPAAALTLVPDQPVGDQGDAGDGADGTFEAVVLPPDLAVRGRPRDVVLVLDRSGSMAGWKMVAARRAAARIVDTLGDGDRFAVLAFDHLVETPGGMAALVPGTDRERFRAVEFLAGLDARGGTELSEPLRRGLALLGAGAGPGPVGGRGAGGPADEPRPERVLVLVTDGQVGNEDQILRTHARGLGAVRVHTVGVDQAVNAGFLGRLAGWGGGRCELVESEDRLDAAMARIHARIAAPLITGVSVEATGVTLLPDTMSPIRPPEIFPGVPWILRGRYRGTSDARLSVRGTTATGEPWIVEADGQVRSEPALAATWARGRVRDLEDRYVAETQGYLGLDGPADHSELEQQILRTSLAFGVLCRFTAYVAVDERVVTEGGVPRRVVQPVERPAGWNVPTPPAPMGVRGRATAAPAAAPAPAMGGLFAARLPAATFAAGIVGVAAASMPSFGGAGGAGGAADGADGEPEAAVELLERELERWRSLAGEPAARRRQALEDASSWITTLGDPNPPSGVPDAAWDRLVQALRPERLAGEPFEAVWTEALAGLGAVVEAALAARPGPEALAPELPGHGRRRRPAFWKHHPEV